MNQRVHKVLTVVLAALLVIGLAGSAWSLMGYQLGAQDYSEAEKLAGVPAVTEPAAPAPQKPEVPSQKPQEPVQEAPEEDPYATALLETDLAALQEVNGDVLGWIQIPGMELSYPLVQGTDNDYYLHQTWQKKQSSVGSVFLDYRNSGDLNDFNTVIYGHNMKNGSMFGELDLFRDKTFLDEHPYVYIVDDAGCRRYSIFAAFEVSVSTAEAYQLSFSGEEDKQSFIDSCLALSDVTTEAVPTVEDRIITLSTCTGLGYSTRWVVQAVLDLEVPR